MFHRPLYFSNLTILTADGPIGHSLRVQGSRIVALNDPPEKKDVIIDGGGGVLIPGLINAHDHLELNNFKRLKYRDRYSHSLAWIEDIEARFDSDPDLIEPRRHPLAERLLIGLLKNLLSGVTTVCHHNPFYRPLHKNERIRIVKEYGFCHSLFRGDDPGRSYRRTNRTYPWLIHLAEGTDAAAEAEFAELDRRGLLQENTVLVHGVGLTAEQRQALAERGGGLVWCPGSNDFLFGQTAQVRELAAAGKLALGSDSRLTGEFDLLHELQMAHRSGQLSPQSLFRAVTTDAARILRLRHGGRGQITVGGAADLVLLPPLKRADGYAEIFSLERSQLELVMLEGKPLVTSEPFAPLFAAARIRAAPVMVDGVVKWLPRRLAARLKRARLSEPGLQVG